MSLVKKLKVTPRPWKAYIGMLAYYGLLAAVTLGPLLARGFVLTEDMVFTPRMAWPSQVTNSYLLEALMHILNFVLPADIVQKLLLLTILMAGGIGMHCLYRVLLRPRGSINQLGAFVAGTIYVLNPFTYTRWMTGQYYVLLGVAVLPWVGLSLTWLVKKQSVRNTVQFAFFVTLLSIVSIHLFAASLLLFMPCALAAVFSIKTSWRRLRPLCIRLAVSLGMAAIASSYWLLPLLLGKGQTAANVAGFSGIDQRAFATSGESFWIRLASVLRLQGFWGDTRGLYALPNDRLPYWPLVSVVVLLLVVAGAGWLLARKKTVGLLLITSVLLAAICATGLGIQWLGRHIPLLAGFREPQKFAAFILLGYALWCGEATEHIRHSTIKILSALSFTLLILPFLWAPSMAWGFNDQLIAAHYPDDWATAYSLLQQEGSPKTLFLPWHEYMYFHFSGRLMGSPAVSYFGNTIIASKDPEYAGLLPETTSQFDLDVQATAKPPYTKATTARLKKLGIHYVLLAKEGDYKAYNLQDTQELFSGPTITLYRLK